ncbi:MAG: AfsR/SARP family transcriptional regulator [Jatrophihabitantaceae bacterium]
MQVDLLGSVAVHWMGGPPHPIKASKVRAMLATLALEVGKTVSRSELADELWGTAPVGNVCNALQANATRLRKALEPFRDCRADCDARHAPVVRSVHNGYLLDLPSDAVDVNRFNQHAKQGNALVRDQPRQAIAQLECALDLWQGSALLDAGDGLRCRSAAVRLEQARLSVWEDLIAARIILREGRLVIAQLHQLGEQYPLHERFCEQLMLVLYRTGRQSDALEAFHQVRHRLDTELGLEPSRPLRRRYQEILAQDPGLLAEDVVWRWREEYSMQH